MSASFSAATLVCLVTPQWLSSLAMASSLPKIAAKSAHRWLRYHLGSKHNLTVIVYPLMAPPWAGLGWRTSAATCRSHRIRKSHCRKARVRPGAGVRVQEEQRLGTLALHRQEVGAVNGRVRGVMTHEGHDSWVHHSWLLSTEFIRLQIKASCLP